MVDLVCQDQSVEGVAVELLHSKLVVFGPDEFSIVLLFTGCKPDKVFECRHLVVRYVEDPSEQK